MFIVRNNGGWEVYDTSSCTTVQRCDSLKEAKRVRNEIAIPPRALEYYEQLLANGTLNPHQEHGARIKYEAYAETLQRMRRFSGEVQ